MSKQSDSEEEILVIMNTLIYSSGLNKDQENKSIYEVISKVREEGRNICPKSIAKNDWTILEDTILKNEDIYGSLTIQNLTPSNDISKSMALTDPAGNLFIVYRGTDAGEWSDNAATTYLADTKLQIKALTYYDDMVAKFVTDDTRIILSGHSKGGNNAMYVTALRDRVDQTYSYDGNGFSMEFHYKYREQIEKNKDKIKSINAKNDYVNALSFHITDHIYYTNYDKSIMDMLLGGDIRTHMANSHGDNPISPDPNRFNMPGAEIKKGIFHLEYYGATEIGLQHSLITMLEVRNGEMKLRNYEKVEQDPIGKLIRSLMQYAAMHMEPKDFQYFAHLIVMGIEDKEFKDNPMYSVPEEPDGCWERLNKLLVDYAVLKLDMDRKNADNFANMVYKLLAKDKIKIFNFPIEGILTITNAEKASILPVSISAIRNLNHAEIIDIERNFTDAYKAELIELVTNPEDVPYLDITDWDSWYEVEDIALWLISTYNFNMKNHYQDINSFHQLTGTKVEEVFANVYAREAEFNTHLKKSLEGINDANKLLEDILNSFNI